MKTKTHRDPCGCTHDGRRWLNLCETHQAEATERHERAKRDYQARRAELDARWNPQPSPAAPTWLEV